MNNLFQHIEYLLLRHECVVVPGFGAFISRRLSASVDMEKGVILPPSVSVSFNRSVSFDDGLLVNSYMRKYGLTIEEARLSIVRAVSLLQLQLSSEKEVSFGKIGRLSMDEENHIFFSPLPDPLTFSSFTQVPLSSSGNAEEGIVNSYLSEEKPDYSQYYHFRISKKVMRIAATIFAVLAVCLTVMLNPIPSDNREQRASVLPVETLISLKSEKAAIQVDSSITSPIIEENAEIPEIKKPIVKQLPNHYLIIGTFSTEKEAARFSESCGNGDVTFEIVPSKKVFRVSAASSDSKEELQEILNSRKFRNHFPNAWIWSRI